MMEDLKPCPFCCGRNIVVTHETADATVYCADCFGEIKIFRRGVIAPDLHAQWNTRPVEDALSTDLELLRQSVTALLELAKAVDSLEADTLSSIRRQTSGPLCKPVILSEGQKTVIGSITAARAKCRALGLEI